MNADEMVKMLRDDANNQENLLHVCASTRNALKAADLIERLQAQLTEVRRERDAAVKDLEKAMPHWCCKNKSKGYCPVSAVTGMVDCDYCGDWQWRGVQEAGEGKKG